MQSIAIIAFDQHAATTVAAVLLPRQRTPVLHTLTSEPQTILRLVQRLQRHDGVPPGEVLPEDHRQQDDGEDDADGQRGEGVTSAKY